MKCKSKIEFLERLSALSTAALETARKKNEDYATDDDPFKNFRAAETYGVPVERAMLVRMSDKMARISNLLDRPASVEDESILDTCSDLSNYALILRVWLEDKLK